MHLPCFAIKCRLAVLLMVALILPAQAKDSCTTWKDPAAVPENNQYSIQMRICEVSYGLSAYIQLHNLSAETLDLSYKINLASGESREENIIVPPKVVLKAGLCQACAKRHDGFKTWEIVEVMVAKEKNGQETGSEESDSTEDIVKSSAEDEKVIEPAGEKDQQGLPAKTISTQAPTPKTPTVPVEQTEKKLPPEFRSKSAKEPKPDPEVAKKENEGDKVDQDNAPVFNIEDLPPEFRPR